MRLTFIIVFGLAYSLALGQEKYEAQFIGDQGIIVDARATDLAWSKGNELLAFTYPWQDENAPYTSFKGVWDKTNFYFIYEAKDDDIVLFEDCKGNDEFCAVASDRIEIFFRNKDTKKSYYSLEMDVKGRVFDSKSNFVDRSQFSNEWDWPTGHLIIKGRRTDGGYIVEGKISLQSLRDLDILEKGSMYAGLYRGEYISKKGDKPTVKWISWVKPDSKTPNFHIPSSFGIINLSEK